MIAFITGVTGQDGHYLSEFLIEQGYTVYGLVRRTSQSKHIPEGVIPVEGDVTDTSVGRLIAKIGPDEVYHLAAMSHVGESFHIPYTTFQSNAVGTLNILEALRGVKAKLYNAATSELFGSHPPPQNERTPFHPRSPYGAAKLAAFSLAVNYREAYGMFVCSGILFNHESPIRGDDFVTQKIATAAARIALKKQRTLQLGNLDAYRDWGHARDYVRGMWLMLQHSEPDDYVLATGTSHSVREFVDYAFRYVGLNYSEFVEHDSKLLRPADVPVLCGDPSKARKVLGWKQEYTFEALIEEMVDFAIERERQRETFEREIPATHSYH